jgi:DNA polymerase-3 subunit delta'
VSAAPASAPSSGPYAATFSGLIGHAGPRRILTAALAGGRLPHALLFHGPAGVGKGDWARRLAAALLCTDPGRRPCGACAACGRIAHGNAFDLMTLGPDGAQIKVEQVRALKDLVHSGVRPGVALVEPADAMNQATANTLLKTLEEPPPGWTLVLVTARPEAVLATIRSRCQAVRYGRLAQPEARDVLADRGVAPEHLDFLARLADGAPGAVLMTGLSPAELAAEYAEAVDALQPAALHSPTRIFAAAEAWGRDPERTRRFLHWVRIWVSEALAGPRASDAARWGEGFSAATLADFLLLAQEAEERLERNANRPIAIEALLVTLATAPPRAARAAGGAVAGDTP